MESTHVKQAGKYLSCLDGATFDIIKPLIDKGELPNIAHIMKSGAHAELNSTVLPHSPSAWTSFSTGKNQETRNYRFSEDDA